MRAVSGKTLTSAETNTATELFPGVYEIELNGTTQRLTVFESKQTAVTAGAAVAPGTGEELCRICDSAEKQLTSHLSGSAVELFPGTYIIEIDDLKRPLVVKAGKTTTVRVK